MGAIRAAIPVAVRAVMDCRQAIEAEQPAQEITERARKRHPAREFLRDETDRIALLGRAVLVQVQSAEVEIVAAMEAAAQAAVRQIVGGRTLRHLHPRLLQLRHRQHQAAETAAEEIQVAEAAGTVDRNC